MAEARIDAVIGSSRAEAGARAVSSAIDGIKRSWLEMGARVVIVEQTMERFWQRASRGAQFEETLGRLNHQMGGFHSTAQLMINDLRAITNNTISTADAAQLASRSLAAGFDPEQIKTFARAADVLDDVMGTDLKGAFDQIVQAAITGRSAVLANIGVYVDLEEEVKKLASSTGRTTEQITKQERAMLAAKAITEQLDGSLAKLGDGALSDADRLKQLEARFQDLSTTIDRRFKGAVLGAVDALEWLGDKLDQVGFTEEVAQHLLLGPFAASLQQNAGSDPKMQEILGRAIVADTQGNLARKAARQRSGPSVDLPFELRAKQVEAERTRREQALQTDVELTRKELESNRALIEVDAQRQLFTQEQVVEAKRRIRMRGLEVEGESLIREQELNQQFHARLLAQAGITTEARLEEDERYRSKRFEINEKILKNERETMLAVTEEEVFRQQAREEAEKARGQRISEYQKSAFDIQEAQRERAFQDTQTYLQGEIDAANARFASDEEIARKERALLREQLAFKLRLSQEETNRLLFLKQAGDLEGVQSILDRGDPLLSGRAREGIFESANARDIELRERATGDFFAGWFRGLQKYTRDTESSFGFAQDTARRAAQGMEQGFQRFFFDGMEGKFTRFKDVLSGVLDFTKQIVSQMAAQLVTIGIIKPGASALANLFGSGAGASEGQGLLEATAQPRSVRFGGVQRFAMGGISSRPRMMAMGGHLVEFGEGPQAEAFVPLPDGRTIPVTMRFAGALPTAVPATGGLPLVQMPVTIINQAGVEVETRERRGANGLPQLDVLIRKQIKRAIGSGAADEEMRRYGLSPSPVKR